MVEVPLASETFERVVEVGACPRCSAATGWAFLRHKLRRAGAGFGDTIFCTGCETEYSRDMVDREYRKRRSSGAGQARTLLEKIVAKYLENYECMTPERAERAGLKVSTTVSAEELRELARAVERQGVPWSEASGMALSVAVHNARQGEKAYTDTPSGRVTAEAELERLLDRFEQWKEARDREG